MTQAAAQSVRQRLVVMIYGYQATEPKDHYRHFGQDLRLFDATWSLATDLGPMRVEPGEAEWDVRARGPGWETRTRYRILRLDDLIARGQRRPLLRRVAAGYLGLLDFVLDRAILGYARFAWRYAAFTLTPLVLTGVALALGAIASWILAAVAGWPAGLIAGIVVALAGLVLSDRYAYLVPVLEDWAFASGLVRHIEPEIEARLASTTEAVAQEAASGAYDEILLIGHSLGAVFVLHLAERLIAAAAPAARTRLVVLTVGSSLLKIGLHRAAHGIRRAVRAVTAAPDLTWVDYQSRIDIMNFPGVDPAAALGVRADRPPAVRLAPFRAMVDPAAYRRLVWNPFRCHNQFVRMGTRRASYDYYIAACGPFRMSELAGVAGGAAARFGPDGSLR